MNLLIRFTYQTILSFFLPKLSLEDEDRVALRVLPNDLDLNWHLNNGRYLSMMDLGRMRITIRMNFHKMAMKYKWGAVVGGARIVYLRSLGPLQKFTLITKPAGIYKDWFFVEQRFESKGKLAAAALVKVTFVKNGKRILGEEVLEKMGVVNPEVSPYLESFFESEKEFLSYIKSKY